MTNHISATNSPDNEDSETFGMRKCVCPCQITIPRLFGGENFKGNLSEDRGVTLNEPLKT